MKKVKMPKQKIKKGDMVVAITGDDAGKTGKVLQIMSQKGRAVVEGLNLVTKHLRKSQDNPNGGIVEKEAPIALSNLKPVEASK
ncbi:MAG: 50S ribosomal protein L24 [Kiritimatiellae bacterium]|nr:50S ribosomal protein L24 [Kiritimatiellia bacterium]MDD4736305.1 50S ribosomal protein L24 [Kiritimatiellia bacterium]